MIIRLSILMFKINQQGLDSLAKCSLMINDLCQSLYMEIFPMIFLTKILQKLSNSVNQWKILHNVDPYRKFFFVTCKRS